MCEDAGIQRLSQRKQKWFHILVWLISSISDLTKGKYSLNLTVCLETERTKKKKERVYFTMLFIIWPKYIQMAKGFSVPEAQKQVPLRLLCGVGSIMGTPTN